MKTIAQCHLLKAVSHEGHSTRGYCSVQNRADRYAICLSNVALFLCSHPKTLLVFGFLLPPVWFGTLEPLGEPALLICKQHRVELHGRRSKPPGQKKKAVVWVLCYLYSTPQLPFEAAVCLHPLTWKREYLKLFSEPVPKWKLQVVHSVKPRLDQLSETFLRGLFSCQRASPRLFCRKGHSCMI